VTAPARALFVNENIGGHATVHHHLRRIAAGRDDLSVRFVDVPPPGFWRKVAGVGVPGLGRLDADLRSARYQLAQSAWVARRLPGWLAEGFDVVHFYTHNAALLAHRALDGRPYVVTLDSTTAQSNRLHVAREATRFTDWSTTATRPFERRVYAGAVTVVANSCWVADSLAGDYGVDRARIEVLPMGVPVPPAVPSAPRAGLPRVLFIGRGMDRKGGTQLRAVHQRWLADWCELVLVTQSQVEPGRNLTVVGDARPGDGLVDRLLADSALMVLPSRIDQWPNAVMEAMAIGVPPVVSRVGGLPEMVADGAGVVLADDSDETLRDTIAGLLADPVRRAAIGARARRRVEEDLDVQQTANRLLDVVHAAARCDRAAAAHRPATTHVR
jgi:glycosyltransferase involved in cell wall biosynthesis